MTENELTAAEFPSFRDGVRARWAPVLLEPIAGSYERLVIGVAVVSDAGFHVEAANSLDRLRCLYGEDADGPIYAIRLATEYLARDLAQRGARALIEPSQIVSGTSIGTCRDAEGASLKAIGASWMTALSSLYAARGEEAEYHELEAAAEMEPQAEAHGDRLPMLVLSYVADRREGLTRFFSADLRDGRVRRLTGRSHEVIIDYSGSRLVANFGTLQAGGLARSMNLIKRRLWDMKVERDRDTNPLTLRPHEILLQSPSPGDPQVSSKQHANIREALYALEQQADQEQLRLRALHSVQEIGEHVLQLEAA